jgi:3-deoxy-D-manno-octulosonate 8-phosphate phosphatase (KDO 8-P phosphatase)
MAAAATPHGAPAQRFAPELLLAAQGPRLGLRCAFFDVDGVLTDGRLYIDADGESLKAFHVQDGQGLKLLQAGGIEPVIISGRSSAALRRRLADLGLQRTLFGVEDKLAAAASVLTELGLDWGDAAAIGDDWPDLPLLEAAAFACAPPNAHIEVRARVHHVTTLPGGGGAVREFCDLLLVAAGRYATLLDQFRGQTLDAR